MGETLYSGIKSWLETSKKNSVKSATYDRLQISFKLLCQNDISNREVKTLSPTDIQEYLNWLVRCNYSMSTIKKQRDLLSAYLRKRYAEGVLKSPLYLTVELPSESSISKETREVVAYSVEEQTKLNAELDRHLNQVYICAILMLEAGLRIGEALALNWNDIFWERRALRVNKTLIRITGGRTFIQKGAKSKSSNRIIPLSERAFNSLKTLYFKGASGLVFKRRTPNDIFEDQPLSYATVKYYLSRACRNADVEYRGCHIFRHTFATNCYYKGCDVKILSKLLGHADVSITYNIYINLYGDALEDMRKVIG